MKEELFIIDDDPIYRLIVSKFVSRINPAISVNQCENGEVGLASLKSLQDTNHRIIVILDLNMPVLDGWGFLDEIKKNNFYNLDQLTINIVTSSTDELDKSRAQQHDFVKGF